MNFKDFLQEFTPFIVLSPVFILISLYAMFNIWRANDISVMLLPQALAILVVGVLFLFLDRWAIKNWSQQMLVFVELMVIGGIYLAMAYQSRALVLEVKESVTSFQVISSIGEKRETSSTYVFPFSRKIVVGKNRAVVFLNQALLEVYSLEVKTGRDYVTSGHTHSIGEKKYRVREYRLDEIEKE